MVAKSNIKRAPKVETPAEEKAVMDFITQAPDAKVTVSAEEQAVIDAEAKRRKGGRPKGSGRALKPKQQITIIIEQEMLDRIDAIVDKIGCSRTAYFRMKLNAGIAIDEEIYR